jgi:peptide/nickel transport system substrate-binding protein
VRNPDYWQKGKPYIDTIVTKFITDDTQRASTLTSGGAQAALEGAYQNIQQYQASGKYDTVHTPTYGGGYGFGMNISKAPFDDIRVRQAMSLTLNAADLTARSQYGGKEDVITTVDLKSSPFYDPKLKMPKTDVPAAQKLVDAYIADHGGKPIEFTYLSFNTPNFVRMGQAVQAVITSSLKNVTVKLDVQEPVAGVPRQASGDFQAAQLGPRWTDPAIDMPVYFQTGASQNYMRWSNPAVDDALSRMVGTTDPKVTLAAHHTVVENVLKDLPIVWIVRANVYYAIEKAAIGGWRMFYELRPIVEDVYLKKPSA